jgi:hypothetical protein
MNAPAGRRVRLRPVRSVSAWLGSAAALVTVVSLTGCGSSSEASPTVTWANGLCSAVTTYSTALKDAATSVKSGGVSQSSLQDAAGKVSDATQTFASSIKDLGTPDTESGAAAKQTIDDLASSLQDDANAVKDATSGSSSALSAVSSVTATLASAQTQVTNAIDDLRSLGAKSELQDAFSEAPNCSSVPGLG